VSGTQYAVLALCYPFVMAATAYIFLPVYTSLDITTSYEYLELRFHKSVRLLASACFTLQMVLYMAIVVYAPALALSQVTGFNLDIACFVIFAVCIFYTAIGGIKAVIWTDVFQATCMFGSFLAIIIKGNDDVGGANTVWSRNYESGRVELFNFEPDLRRRHTFWGCLIGGFFTWISVYGINQAQVQRYLTVKKPSQAVKAIWWNVIGIGSLLLICAYGGLVVYAYYHDCDPIKSRQVAKKDQLFPLFVMQVMGDIPGVPGLFVAGVFSGALSTVSSGLNSLAAVCLKDFFGSGCNLKLSEDRAALVTKILAVVFGVIGYGIVFLVKYLPGVLEAALGIFGIVGGPVLGVFTLGMFFPFANSVGAFIGCFSSLIFTMWMGFGSTVASQAGTHNKIWNPKMSTSIENCPLKFFNSTVPAAKEKFEPFTHLELYEVSYIWYSAIAWLWCLVVGIIISAFRPSDHRRIDRRLITPALPNMFGIYPRVVRDWIKRVYDEIGSDLRENEMGFGPVGSLNKGYNADMKEQKF